MFRRLSAPILLLLAIVLSLAGFCPPGWARPPLDGVGVPMVEGHPPLWAVKRGETTIYLFGTFHIVPRTLDWFNGPVAAAFAESDEVITEILPPSQEEIQRAAALRGLLPVGQNLRDLLPKGDRARFEQALRANGLQAGAFDRYRPWFAAMELPILPLDPNEFDLHNGPDIQISRRAEAEGTRRGALETVQLQFDQFGSLPPRLQLSYLHDVLAEMPAMRHTIASQMKAWSEGNVPALARLVDEDNDDPELRKRLVVARNRNWANWIHERLARPGTVFVAVGAGHLVGRDSVQAQLNAMGIHAERVQ